MAGSDRERADRQAVLQQAEADFDPLPFDAAAARAFGRVAATLRRSGRKPLSQDLPMHTSNPADFAGIDGLTVVPVELPA